MSCQECYSPGNTLVNLFYEDDGKYIVMRDDAYHGLCDRHLSAFREIVSSTVGNYWKLLGGVNPAEVSDDTMCAVCGERGAPHRTVHLCKVTANNTDTVKPGNIILTESIELCDVHMKKFTEWLPQVTLDLLDCVR